MCIICVSGKGVRQPNETEVRTMFRRNPHGAGYMVAEPRGVRVEKGFMNVTELLRSLRQERFTEDDVVVYHFRISTQAGVNPEMTQPFPMVQNLESLKYLTAISDVGVAHNGIIPLTSDPTETEYSDTALFIAFYLTEMVRRSADLTDEKVLDKIQKMIHSKMVLLDKFGTVSTIGDFVNRDGLLFSNYSFTDDSVRSRGQQFTLSDVIRWRKAAELDEELQGRQ